MSQQMRSFTLILAVSVVLACGPRRPDFSPDRAREELAGAFDLSLEDVSMLSEGKPPQEKDESDADYRARAEVWVDFKVPAMRQTLQARFVGRDATWELDGVRERPRGDRLAPWNEVGEMLGEVRTAASQNAERTIALISELGAAVEALAVDSGNEFPRTDIQGLARLLVSGRYLEKWEHAEDAWGNTLHFYTSATGDAYTLISRGADNRFDFPVDVYNAKTDAGDFTYEGVNSDPALDLIYATGSFVQRYRPSE